jgi:hypothetical protein
VVVAVFLAGAFFAGAFFAGAFFAGAFLAAVFRVVVDTAAFLGVGASVLAGVSLVAMGVASLLVVVRTPVRRTSVVLEQARDLDVDEHARGA